MEGCQGTAAKTIENAAPQKRENMLYKNINQSGKMSTTIRPAHDNDLQRISDIYSHAREQMILSGNPNQWGNDKPSPETIKADIDNKQSYTITSNGQICGVFAFIIGPDPTYQIIEDGSWLNDEPYGTIHRIASSGQIKGILAEVLSFCECRIRSIRIHNIRIDTHEDNQIMQHLLEKYSYTKCGHIYVEDGTQRIAYQKKVMDTTARKLMAK